MTDALQAPWKFWLSVVLAFVQMVVSAGAIGWIMFRGFETAGCSPDCGAADLMTVLYTLAGFCLAVFVGTVVLTTSLRARRWAWLIPAIGIPIIVAGGVVANTVANAALSS